MNEWLIVIGSTIAGLFAGFVLLNFRIAKLDRELDQNLTGNRGLSDEERERKTRLRESRLWWHKIVVIAAILVLLLGAIVVSWPALESFGLFK